MDAAMIPKTRLRDTGASANPDECMAAETDLRNVAERSSMRPHRNVSSC